MRLTTTAMLTLALLAPVAGMRADDDKDEPDPPDGAEMPVNKFLEYVRYPVFLNSWARLDGVAEHKSKGRRIEVPISLRARFKRNDWRMQIVIDGGECWLVRQIPADGVLGTTSIQQQDAPEDKVGLRDLMIRPADLTLGFLYWPFVRELDKDRLKTVLCRVLELQHKSGEKVRIWISTKYFFPLRVQWFKPGAKEPYRRLDFKGTTKIKSSVNEDREIVLVKEVTVKNPGWKTRIRFSKREGDEVTPQMPPPKDLFVVPKK